MLTPTSRQARALDMFQCMCTLPEDDHHFRAVAVAHCLAEEGIDIARGYFHQLTLLDGSIADVEVLCIDGALVDANGVHAHWQAVAADYPVALNARALADPLEFSPKESHWIGNRAAPRFEQATRALRAAMDQRALRAATDEAPLTARMPRRM